MIQTKFGYDMSYHLPKPTPFIKANESHFNNAISCGC